jgi:NCS1 family nucleobase:cation symporter-1
MISRSGFRDTSTTGVGPTFARSWAFVPCRGISNTGELPTVNQEEHASNADVIHSAKSFSSFLGGYAMFLGAIAGIIVTDFWICRGRKLAVWSLYEPRGIYYYNLGVNPRAVVAFVVAIIPNMPGLAAARGAKGVPKGALYLYSLSWLVSTLLAGFTYWSCWKMWPYPVDQQEEVYLDAVPDMEESSVSEKEL